MREHLLRCGMVIFSNRAAQPQSNAKWLIYKQTRNCRFAGQPGAKPCRSSPGTAFPEDIHKVIHRKSGQPAKVLANQGLGQNFASFVSDGSAHLTPKQGLAKVLTMSRRSTYAQNRSLCIGALFGVRTGFQAVHNFCNLLNFKDFSKNFTDFSVSL